MKNKVLSIFFLACTVVGLSYLQISSSNNSSNKRFPINKIRARVNIEGFKGVNILESDLKRPRIEREGGTYTLEEAIMEELMFQKASEKHLLANAADIERQIVAFKMQNDMTNLSDEEFEAQLKESGFRQTNYQKSILNDYKEQLARVMAIENLKRAEINEKIVVSSQEVEKYYKKNPAYTKEEYHLKIATLTPEQEKNYQELLDGNKIKWKDLGFIAREDIDSHYEIVFAMKKGEISEPIHAHGKINICMLADKHERRLQTLDERYGTIERTLQQKKREELIPAFEKELRNKAYIVYFE